MSSGKDGRFREKDAEFFISAARYVSLVARRCVTSNVFLLQ